MKERTKGFLAGILVSVLILALIGTAFATVGTRTATLNYSDIKITLDGKALTPKDVNGNVVEPFIIDGTTYLPVRGISSSLGLGVAWNPNTHTVVLTSDGSDPVSQSSASQPSSQAVSTSDGKRVKIVEASDYMHDNYLHYCYVVENTSATTAFDGTKVTCTAYDSTGNVLATETSYVGSLQPGEKQAGADFMSCNGGKPAKVEMLISSGDEAVPSDKAVRSSDFVITGTNERRDDLLGSTITGTIKNTSSNAATDVKLVILFRKNGKIVYGDYTYTSISGSSGSIPAGAQIPFDYSVGSVPDHDSFEVWASSWN